MGGCQSKTSLPLAGSGGAAAAAAGTATCEATNHNPNTENPPVSVACPSCGGRSSSCCCCYTREPSDISCFRFTNSVSEPPANLSSALGSTAATAAAAAERIAAVDEMYECVDSSSFASQAASAAAATVQREAGEAAAARAAAALAARGKAIVPKPAWGGPLWPVFDVRLQPRPVDASGPPAAPTSVLQVEDTVLKKHQRGRATKYVGPGFSLVDLKPPSGLKGEAQTNGILSEDPWRAEASLAQVLAAMENCLQDHHMFRISYSPKLADSAFEYRHAHPGVWGMVPGVVCLPLDHPFLQLPQPIMSTFGAAAAAPHFVVACAATSGRTNFLQAAPPPAREAPQQHPFEEEAYAAASAAVEQAADSLADIVASQCAAPERRRGRPSRCSGAPEDDTSIATLAAADAAAAERAGAEAAAAKATAAAEQREFIRGCFREQAERMAALVRATAAAAAIAAADAEAAAEETPAAATAVGLLFNRSLQLPEAAWRSLGIRMGRGWVHVGTSINEPNAFLFARPLMTDGATGAVPEACWRRAQEQQQLKRVRGCEKRRQQPMHELAHEETLVELCPSAELLACGVCMHLHLRALLLQRLLEAYARDALKTEEKQKSTCQKACILSPPRSAAAAPWGDWRSRNSSACRQQQQQKRMDDHMPQLTWSSQQEPAFSLSEVEDPFEDFCEHFLLQSKPSKRSKRAKIVEQQQQQKQPQKQQHQPVKLHHKQRKHAHLPCPAAICCCSAQKVEQRLGSSGACCRRLLLPITEPLPVWAIPGVHVAIVPSCCSSNNSSSRSSPASPPSCCSCRDTEAPTPDKAEKHNSQSGTAAAAVAAVAVERKRAPLAYVCTIAGLEQLPHSSAGFERFLLHLEPVQQQREQQQQQQQQRGLRGVCEVREQDLFSAVLQSPRLREMTALAGCCGVLPLSLQHMLLLLLQPRSNTRRQRNLLIGRSAIVLGADFARGRRGTVAAIDPRSGASLLRMEGEDDIVPIGCSKAYLWSPLSAAAASN
ncbi:hypothetical protein Esti_006012 [Eimeria stiedai]